MPKTLTSEEFSIWYACHVTREHQVRHHVLSKKAKIEQDQKQFSYYRDLAQATGEARDLITRLDNEDERTMRLSFLSAHCAEALGAVQEELALVAKQHYQRAIQACRDGCPRAGEYYAQEADVYRKLVNRFVTLIHRGVYAQRGSKA